jgi:hypothetical protein
MFVTVVSGHLQFSASLAASDDDDDDDDDDKDKVQA